ncbi:uncharacterized protein LOC117227940 [Megalopta genalis]|uniref:uncharacterized protein LOC117227940 n=1 Tax=Megalopta genalis TaxID=115081 RepID=UPI00144302C0|nr:uncharacterized protein LOC117227940 [Megalopta genalis]
MMASNIKNIENNGSIDRKVTKLKIRDSKCSNYMHMTSDELVENEHISFCNESNKDIYCNKNKSLETNTITEFSEQEVEHTLYKDSQNINTSTKHIDTLFTVSNSALRMKNQNRSPIINCTISQVPTEYSKNIINNELLCSHTTLKPTLYEQCSDLSNIEECEDTSSSVSQTCLQGIGNDFTQYAFDNNNVTSNIEKCIKVYSHKRHKSMDEIKRNNVLTNVNNVMHNPSTDCIDLLDEPSTNDIPVTLLTSLDMESAEYIISLSTENIQSIVGAKFNEQNKLNIYQNDCQHIVQYSNREDNINKKELNTGHPENSNYMKPILRRSLRINQHDPDGTTNSNEISKEHNRREKYFRKSNSLNKLEMSTKRKRKVKSVDYRISEQGINNILHLNKKTFKSSHKNRTKLIKKRNDKSQRVTVSRRRKEQSIKITNRMKCDISQMTELKSILTPSRLNTMEHVNRALWGDMSDYSEDYENKVDLDESALNTKIPFAVGLLPLRTALEKMQATPDYQPRKTRSSVVSIKQETNFFKQKSYTYSNKITASTRQHFSTSHPKEDAKTVCRIQIRAAPSEYMQKRKKHFTTNMATLKPSAIINKQ